MSVRARNYWQWARQHPNGYEVTTAGDKRFSAFHAKVGKHSIEYLYQVIVKGYDSIEEGKGKPALRPFGSERELFEQYLLLWRIWAEANPALLQQLADKSGKSKILTDKFATSPINQAHALSIILTEKFGEKPPRIFL